MNYAVIENGTVVNVIVYDGIQPLELPDGQTLVDLGESEAWIGWRYEGGEWIAPTVEDPPFTS